MVITRSGTRVERSFQINGITLYYSSDQESEFEEFETRYQLIEDDPPSYDYAMGEILSTEHLPKYEDLYYDLPSYQDVQEEKFWEKKKALEKEIEYLEIQKNYHKRIAIMNNSKAAGYAKKIQRLNKIYDDNDLIRNNENFDAIINDYNKKRHHINYLKKKRKKNRFR